MSSFLTAAARLRPNSPHSFLRHFPSERLDALDCGLTISQSESEGKASPSTPTSFSLHLSFTTYAFSSHSQLLREIFFMDGPCTPLQCLLLQAVYLCPATSSLWRRSTDLLCHESSRVELVPHCAMLFSAHLLRLAAVHQFGSHFLSSVTRSFSAPNQNFSLPVHSSYLIVSSHMLLSPFSKKMLASISALYIVLASSCTCCPFHILRHRYLVTAHHSVRCLVFSLFLSTKVQFSFDCGFTICPFLHQAMEAGCVLQSCMHFSLLVPAGRCLLSLPP